MYYKNIHTNQIINWNDMEFGTIEKSFCGICCIEEDGCFDKNQELVEDIICDICSKSWVFVDEDNDSESESEYEYETMDEDENETMDEDENKDEDEKNEPSKDEEEPSKI
jgi:hypothetical protein